MEERRQYGFRVRPNYGEVLGYIDEGEPLSLQLPQRHATNYVTSHFYLDDFFQSSQAASDQPLPHTHINPAAAFEGDDEGYRGSPFPQPPRTSRSSGASSATAAATSGPWTRRRRWGLPGVPQAASLGQRLQRMGETPLNRARGNCWCGGQAGG